MAKFSNNFNTYADWRKAHPENTTYNRRIASEHVKFPKANLSQLRGHPGKRKPISKMKSRKKPRKMEIVVSGNVRTDDRSQSATNVYVEFYIKSSRNEEIIGNEIFKSLEDKGLRVFPVELDENIEPVIVNFRNNVPKGGKVISQKAGKEFVFNEISKELHKAGPHNKPGVSHHGDRTKEYAKRKEERRLRREEKKRRYDENEF